MRDAEGGGSLRALDVAISVLEGVKDGDGKKVVYEKELTADRS